MNWLYTMPLDTLKFIQNLSELNSFDFALCSNMVPYFFNVVFTSVVNVIIIDENR